MPRPGVFNRLKSYFWQDEQPTKQLEITIDEQPKQQAVTEQPQVSFAAQPKTEGPNEELRSFFESTGDRELSKVEVLGVLNLISQAVVRDESVLDLSNVSRSANSSAFPPNMSHSFSMSSLADLTGGISNRSISNSRSRRSLASGPKRQSSKSLTRSQSSNYGISLAKAAAPVNTRSRRPTRAQVRAPLNRSEISQTASDVLDSLDDPVDRFGSIQPSSTSTMPMRAPVSASTPAKPRPSRLSPPVARESAQPPAAETSLLKPLSSFASNSAAPKKDASAADASKKDLPPSTPAFSFANPQKSDFEPRAPSFKAAVPDRDAVLVQAPKPFQAAVAKPVVQSEQSEDVDMDMSADFDFPQTGSSSTVNPAQYQQHIDEFAF